MFRNIIITFILIAIGTAVKHKVIAFYHAHETPRTKEVIQMFSKEPKGK